MIAWAIVMRQLADHIHRVFVGFIPVSTVMTYGSAALLVVLIHWAKHGKPRGHLVAWIQQFLDGPHWTGFLQLLHFVTRFARCRASAGERLTLIVAVGSEARQRMYERAARHRRVIEHCKGAPEPASLYKVSTPTPNIRTLTHEPVIHTNLDSRRP